VRGLELVGPHDMVGHDAGQKWARVSRAVVKSHGHRAAIEVAPKHVLKIWRGRLSQEESDAMIARMDVTGYLAAQLVGLDGFGAGDPTVFLEGPNEPGKAQAKRLVGFYKQLKKLAADLGYRVLGFNMATGDYDAETVQYMREAELDLWGFHCYMTREKGPTPWNAERPFAWTDEFPVGLVLPGDPDWVANEWGHDRTRDGHPSINEGYLPLGDGPYGWEKQFEGVDDPVVDAFVQLVGAADRVALLSPKCRGFCLFTTSPDDTWKKKKFDCDRLALVFVDALGALSPVPNPQPTPNPVPIPPSQGGGQNGHPGSSDEEFTVPPTFPGILGVDLSNHQGPQIPWEPISAFGRFAVIKASDEGEGAGPYYDPYFKRNWEEAGRLGLVRGAYHYGRPHKWGAEKSLDVFSTALGRVGGLLPGDFIVLDSEDPDSAGMPGLVGWHEEWGRRAYERFGRFPGLYSGAWYMTPNGFNTERLSRLFWLWFASYQNDLPPVPRSWPSIKMWQFAQHGRIPGLNQDMLLDLFLGSEAELRALGNGLLPESVDMAKLVPAQDGLWEQSEKLHHAKTMPKKAKQAMALTIQKHVITVKEATGQQ
jgi:hypothetical protein